MLPQVAEPGPTGAIMSLSVGALSASRVEFWTENLHNDAMRRRIDDQERFAHFVTFSVERRRRLQDFDHPQRIVLGVRNLF
jgi:hypothetical protein